jgi:hypothetical protein
MTADAAVTFIVGQHAHGVGKIELMKWMIKYGTRYLVGYRTSRVERQPIEGVAPASEMIAIDSSAIRSTAGRLLIRLHRASNLPARRAPRVRR